MKAKCVLYPVVVRIMLLIDHKDHKIVFNTNLFEGL